MPSNHTTTTHTAIEHIARGHVGVLPVDTVYGLVASARQPEAVARFYALKQRVDKPGTLIAAHTQQLSELGIEPAVLEQATSYWPGPVSIVLPTPDSLDYLSLGQGSLAIRIPADTALRELLDTTGPLITTSANQPGEPTVTAIDQAVAIFGHLVDFYVDGGDYTNRQPSTVMRLKDGKITILRHGAGGISSQQQ